MDENYKKFKELIETKKEKYPNICKLWKGHIKEKQKHNYTSIMVCFLEIKSIKTILFP
jgi:hypothetical protein